MSPEEFPRAFFQAFTVQSAPGIAALLVEDGQALTLSGQSAEGRDPTESAWAAEFAGLLAKARLVTGKTSVKPLGPGAAVVSQRYVVSGALQESGQELPRFPALLLATIIARPEGWAAVSMSFSALSD